jgi:hypothetical protein
MSKKYIFSLLGINIDKVEQKYGFFNHHLPETIPTNTTKIDDLDSSKKEQVISFLDESKSIKKCSVSVIDFSGNRVYKCFWDKNEIPNNISPIGCPIKYIPDRCVKTYFSEITRDKYKISENITEQRFYDINNRNDKRLSTIQKGFYETDGVFCSFNCCLTFIEEEKHNSMYRFSKTLLYQLYRDVNDTDIKEIIPAPHWRILQDFGGNKTIQQFRDSFNKIEYINHGMVSFVSSGRLFEDKIKL